MSESAAERKRSFNALGWALFVVSIVVVAWSAYLGVQQVEYIRCQSKVNDSFSRALKARTDASQQDRNAMDRLVEDISNAKAPGDAKAALDRYRETRTKADADRNKNPLPEPASSAC